MGVLLVLQGLWPNCWYHWGKQGLIPPLSIHLLTGCVNKRCKWTLKHMRIHYLSKVTNWGGLWCAQLLRPFNHSLGRRGSDLCERAPLETKVQAKLGWINEEGSLKPAAVKRLQRQKTKWGTKSGQFHPRSYSSRQTIWHGVLVHSV